MTIMHGMKSVQTGINWEKLMFINTSLNLCYKCKLRFSNVRM